MNSKLILICVCLAGSFCVAQAQTEDWDTYMAMYGNKPGSVLVNMGAIATAPDQKCPYLVVTGPKIQNCGKDGLPGSEEIDKLEEILDATDNFLTGVTAKVLVGTLTYNCERVNYYYVKDTIGIRFAIQRMYNRSFPGYNYALNIKKEPDWHTYFTFLYPDEKTKNWMDNDRVITAMLQQGDSLKDERKIEFDLYFRSDTDRASFVKFAAAKGYSVEKLLASDSHTVPYELIIFKRSYVKTDPVGAMTTELKDEMIKYKGFYNGWKAVK